MTWESEFYNNCTFRRRADLMARALEGDNYNEDSYAFYYCNREYGYISGFNSNGSFECRMADLEELPKHLQGLVIKEIRKQSKSSIEYIHPSLVKKKSLLIRFKQKILGDNIVQ